MKVALNLKDLNDTQTITLASTVITDLTGNAKFTPKPPLPALTTLRGAAQAGVDAVAAARQALTMAVTAKDNALDALRAALTDEASTVEDTINTLPDDQQEAAIESAGMKAQSAPVRVTSLDAVTNLSLTASDTPGVLDWHCDPVDRVRFYVVEYTLDPVSPTAKWLPGRTSTKSSGEITGLTSGASVSVRVHAEGSRGITGAPDIAGPKTAP